MADSLYDGARQQLEEVIGILKIEHSIAEKLMNHDHLLATELEITLDNGESATYKAWRAQHTNVLGPYKGGIRFHTDVSEDEVRALSMWMSWKTSLLGLPLGGGKGGVQVDAKSLSLRERERLSRAYVRALGGSFGPWQDIPAPDVNTGEAEMGWMVDEWRKSFWNDYGMSVNWKAAFTGKPVNLGGSFGREAATGRGGFEVLKKLMPYLALSDGIKVAVQGFGNVGYWFCKLAEMYGWKIVALSDSAGGIYAKDGLDIGRVFSEKITSGRVQLVSGVDKITNEELLELDVDVLVPAALSDVINSENVDKIRADVILELANGPVSPGSEKVLVDKGVYVIPDILANAGGVTVSWMEWVQNLSGDRWREEVVNSKLQVLMAEASEAVWQNYKERDLSSLRLSAYVYAVGNVVKAMQNAGR